MEVLSKHQLTSVKPTCLSVDVAGDDSAHSLVEFELRDSAACKGLMRLFAIAFDRATAHMMTDAAKPNRQLRPIE